MQQLDATKFFVAGGTLRRDAPSYVKRPADDELLKLTLAGEVCYVLTPRQMGKSSLMIRTAQSLQEHGVETVIVDLTRIGTNLDEEQWYLSLLSRIGRGLCISADIVAWWQARARLSAVQRFTDCLHDVILAECHGNIVIFIDEIDSTLNLPFRDDFFAAIRALYNARAETTDLERLTFVLLGVASPTDLINDDARTPFNIGKGIALQEFSREDAAVLQAGLEAVYPSQGEPILNRIYHWTNGHPYLTQKLCQAVTQEQYKIWTDTKIDGLVSDYFFTDKIESETNLKFIENRMRDHPQRNRLLWLYWKILHIKTVKDDKKSLLHSKLKLWGLTETSDEYLRVSNKIYEQVFDNLWIRKNVAVKWSYVSMILAIFVLLPVLFIAFNNRQYPAPMPDGTFNIAVAQFTYLDHEGQIKASSLSEELSAWLYNSILNTFTDQGPMISYTFRGPDSIGVIEGKNDTVRANNAAQAAKELNASILIYGVLENEQASYQLRLEFYISEDFFEYGAEIIGSTRLGAPIILPVEIDHPATTYRLTEILASRVEVMVKTIEGLGHLHVGNYTTAAAYFQSALNVAEENSEGKEVLYYLLGTAHFRNYDSFTSSEEELALAATAFETTVELNPNYSRGYLGLGKVALAQERFLEARDWFLASVDAPDQPANAYVSAEASFGLGEVHLMASYLREPGWALSEAIPFFDRVIIEYDNNRNSYRLAQLAARSYANIGYIAGLNGDWLRMSSMSRSAIEILSDLPDAASATWTARYWTWVAIAEEKAGQQEKARVAYRYAIEIGQNRVSTVELDAWREELERLENTAP